MVTTQKGCVAFAVDGHKPCGPHGYANAPRLGAAQNTALKSCYQQRRQGLHDPRLDLRRQSDCDPQALPVSDRDDFGHEPSMRGLAVAPQFGLNMTDQSVII